MVCTLSWRTILGGCESPVGCRDSVRGSVFDTRYVDHFEAIPEGFLLEVPQSDVADVVEGSVTKYLQEWLVVYSNG